MFPFTTIFHRKIKKLILTGDQKRKILLTIKDELSERKADYFTLTENQLGYENKIFKLVSNINLMGATDGGYINFREDDKGNTIITYRVRLTRIWIGGSIFTLIAFFISEMMWQTAVIAFCGFVLLNWIITLLRHFALSFHFKQMVLENNPQE